MKPLIPIALTVVFTITFASCGNPKPESNPEKTDSIAKITEEGAKPIKNDVTEKTELPKSSSAKSSFPQITSFTDYVYEDHYVYTFSEMRGILRQLDIKLTLKSISLYKFSSACIKLGTSLYENLPSCHK